MRKPAKLFAGLAVLAGVFAGAIVALLSCITVNVPLFGPGELPPLAELRARIELPPGFRISVFAEGLENPRMLRFAPGGQLLVSSPRSGSVLLLEPDRDGDGRSDGVRPLLEELDAPHGLDLRGEWLYIAEGAAVRRVRFDAASAQTRGALETVVDLPSGGNHWTRTLRFGPDDKLYVSVGSTCNACEESDERRAALLRYEPDGTGYTRFAWGLRNSVGFDFHPETGEIWATDNGRDLLGDDLPPCELNRVVQGGFYGWPYAFGDRVPDPDWAEGRAREIAESVPAEHGFGAHTAPLGIHFYRGRAFPEPYRDSAYVAQHGSWNRSRKSGYRVVRLEWDGGEIRESDFAVGFELDEDVIGRPVDVAEDTSGALYVSDDFSGSIYRITYADGGALEADGAD